MLSRFSLIRAQFFLQLHTLLAVAELDILGLCLGLCLRLGVCVLTLLALNGNSPSTIANCFSGSLKRLVSVEIVQESSQLNVVCSSTAVENMRS